jgi:hypothetical protein
MGGSMQVPASNVLGEVGKGYKYAIEILNEGRIGIGAQMVGLAQGAFDSTMPYLFQRKQFGQLIGEMQVPVTPKPIAHRTHIYTCIHTQTCTRASPPPDDCTCLMRSCEPEGLTLAPHPMAFSGLAGHAAAVCAAGGGH